ncbi:hypothetical protein SAMN04488104_10829 [Algoriphagus faecimaris]|uniref:Uncharacterized protein n=1 Tax=Algoriphagus faecimaris TaxID=686796 RepID=A0A1G6Y6K1_9BACT|nr:hypothetical protein SAMN04488104_10829 [Algoriphagus faecimaris]
MGEIQAYRSEIGSKRWTKYGFAEIDSSYLGAKYALLRREKYEP